MARRLAPLQHEAIGELLALVERARFEPRLSELVRLERPVAPHGIDERAGGCVGADALWNARLDAADYHREDAVERALASAVLDADERAFVRRELELWR